MLMESYYSHGCDTATILDNAGQLAELIQQREVIPPEMKAAEAFRLTAAARDILF